MITENKNIVSCSQFEELLTDYLDKTLDAAAHRSAAEHALSCPLCHSLLNDVKESLQVCQTISAPAPSMAKLEARVLSMTMPDTALTCDEFEGYLTDYLDGFLPAAVFHRWERHAALCTSCEDLPGMVVRSIAAMYTYKTEDLAVPEGLHEKVLRATIGTADAAELKPSLAARAAEWVRSFSFPISVPQLAPVAMMLMVAFLMFSRSVSADGSVTGIYQESVLLAKQTYQQGADVWNGKAELDTQPGEPVSGTTFVGGEGSK